MEEKDESPLRRSNSLKLERSKDKVKILNDDNFIFYKEQLGPNALSKKSEIAEVLELCFQPSTKNELGNILFKFWEKIKGCISINKSEICEFDAVCMFALDYVYKHDTVPFSAVSRSLFVYDWQNRLTLSGKNENLNLKCGCFLRELRRFSDFHTDLQGEEMLVNICLGCISTGNVGLSLYLVKFGLIEFPTEVNEKCKKMFSVLVNKFNSFSKLLTGTLRLDDRQTSLSLQELLKRVKENEINTRRYIIMFCILVVVAEYKMYDEIEINFARLKFLTEVKKETCLCKLTCMDIFLATITETMFTFEDIESFIELFLNPFLTADIRKSLVDTSKKIFGDEHYYSNPRSLQDLVRVKVRSSLKNSTSIPEQVSALKLPVAIQEFLNFQNEEIWELLVENHIHSSIERKLNHPRAELEDVNVTEVEDVNVTEVEDVNVTEVEDVNVRELDDRDASIN